ncbi:unnamed protein product [Litomosoides sigmodontis]|uniref:Uncharacterized protein n=1 Tax=Litomosoides sigmodontis TaxID=42156 RepID=A0A3P6UQU4_LITSI|nr:unnamed protein product [Litomosoides sigmodontis]
MLRTLWGRTNNTSNDDDDDRNAIYNDQSSCDGEQESVDYSYFQNHCHFLLLSQKEDRKAERSLVVVAILSAVFIIVEFSGGVLAGSLAIMTDAGHMLSDLLSFIISIIAIRLSRSPANHRLSFGFLRAEILGATISIIIIWVLTTMLVMLALQRIIDNNFDVDTNTMIATASAGVLFNIIMGLVLRYFRCAHSQNVGHSHSHANVNVRAAFIHVLGDFVQSIGVLTAAIVIKITDWKLADPLCTFLFSIIVFITSATVLRDIFFILMEGTPAHINYGKLQNDLLGINGVRTLHSLHVWSLNMDKTALAVHLAIDEPEKATETMQVASRLIRFKHGIHLATIQIEQYENFMLSCKFCKPLFELNTRDMSRADTFKWVSLILISVSTATAEVYSCGGFVKSPDIPIDYSKIQVKLFTAEGNLKFETECSPTNGYYMIPVYNKGDYSIRLFAPDGWFFEPSTFDLKVDGKNDLCTKGDDINFILNSFAVEGVLRSGDGSGPADVALILIAENGTIVSEAKTVANGSYRFRASPGNYLVSTADNSTECIERNKVPVSITTSPVRVSPNLKISGHLLTVSVLSKKQQISGVTVALYSKIFVKLPHCGEGITDTENERRKFNQKLICKMKTDNKGIAQFPCLPPGSYTIQPSLSTDKIRFNFSPELKEITMGSSATKVVFNTLGFTSKGQVLLSGRPVVDAVIYINGEAKGKTDTSGWYVLDSLQDENYTITAKKPHFVFNTVNVKLSAKEAEIPDIVVVGVDVCVTVNAEESINRITSIIFTNQQTKATKSLLTKSDGKICNLQAVGKYVVSVSSANGVVITPKQREIDLSNGPVLDVIFSQFKTDVNVSVICIDDCDVLKMELWKNEILIGSLEGTDHFLFHEIVPDAYKLKMIDNGRFCWEKTEMDVVIEHADLDNLIFRQVGYRTTTRLSHPAKAKWSMLEKPQISGSLDIPAGQFSFCIPLAGVYIVMFEACHKFDKQLYEITVPQEVPLIASASKFMMSTSIELSRIVNQLDDFTLSVKSSTGEQMIPVTSSAEKKLIFTFYLSAVDADAFVTLTPQSKTFLFNPTSHVFKFHGKCHLDEITFKADEGVFLDGQVVPAVEGVNIRSQSRSDPNVILESVTDANGKFRIGPIRNIKDFDITAEKSGYKFEKTAKLGVLNVVKLSQLIITAVDAGTGEPLSNVLISLSGAENYRSNSFIDKTGKIVFVGLRPGEYFLRPILQEYKFDPKSMTVSIKEGEFETVNLKGHRFAYSVFGKVLYPSGQPVPSMAVEAVSEQCNQLQEEDTTNENGQYRIRGLHPKCVYRLVLKTPNGQRLQSYPTHYDIMVNAEDINGIDFVLTHIDERVDVAGDVVFIGINSPPQYKVGLYKNGNLVQQATVVAPSTVFYFEIPAVDDVVYSVRFETIYGADNQKLDSAEVFFTANETFKAVSLSVRSQRKSEVEISSGNYFALPFFFLIAYLFFNHQKALFFVKEIFVRLADVSLPQRSLPSTDDYADAARKRQKLKKAQ